MAAIGAHANLVITDCEITDNLDGGAAAVDGATLVIEGSTVARNAGYGVLLLDAAPSSRVEDCTVEDNAAAGIQVVAGRGARLLRNRVRRNDVGVIVMAGAAPTIEGNELSGNRLGIGVRGEDTDPVVRANTVDGGAGESVIVDESAAGRFEDNRVSG
ncbi:MAG: right-handed parallel beta-helix repeat-containing protein, partial [Candidatus Limnocylindrales bacterium]